MINLSKRLNGRNWGAAPNAATVNRNAIQRSNVNVE
jgi:hypothetical protein